MKSASGTIVKKITEKNYIILTTGSILTTAANEAADVVGGHFFLRRTDKDAFAGVFKVMNKDGDYAEAIKVYQDYSKSSNTHDSDGKDFALVAVEQIKGEEPDDDDIIELQEFESTLINEEP